MCKKRLARRTTWKGHLRMVHKVVSEVESLALRIALAFILLYGLTLVLRAMVVH